MADSSTSRRASFLVLAVFLLGIALGAVGEHLLEDRLRSGHTDKRSHEEKAKIVEQLTHELNLAPEQQKQLDTILTDTMSRYQELHEQIRPQLEQARQQGRERIRAILTPDQRPKFEEFVRRLDEERRKKYGR